MKHKFEPQDGTEGNRDNEWVMCRDCKDSAMAKCIEKTKIKLKGNATIHQKTFQLPEGWVGEVGENAYVWCPRCWRLYCQAQDYQQAWQTLEKGRLAWLKTRAQI